MRKLLFFPAFAVLIFGACNKNTSLKPVSDAVQLSITSISPSSGRYNTAVTITGRNFSEIASNNIVKFNGVTAVVQSATTTTIKAIVPLRAGSGLVTVTANNSATVSGPSFSYSPVSTVYFSGTDGEDAVYWKDGIEHVLPSVQPISYAFTVAVSDTDVYISGFNGINYVFWKNTVMNATPVYANAIYFSGTNIYLAGNNGSGQAIYSKNGNELIPPLKGNPVYTNGAGYIYGIAVLGSDTYLAGFDSYQAVYWKNETEYILPVTTVPTYASANAIAIVENDIYIAGSDGSRPVYWKNGIEHLLPANSSNAGIGAMAVDGNDIYFVGTDFRSAVYWKNNVEFNLPLLSNIDNYSGAYAITISNGDVYIAGSEASVLPTGATVSGTPEYWKNGTVYALPMVHNGNGGASGVGVVSR